MQTAVVAVVAVEKRAQRHIPARRSAQNRENRSWMKKDLLY